MPDTTHPQKWKSSHTWIQWILSATGEQKWDTDNPSQINTLHNPAPKLASCLIRKASKREPSAYNKTHTGIIISDELCIRQKRVYIIIIITARAVTDAVLTTWRYFNTQHAGTKLSVQLFASWAATHSLSHVYTVRGCAPEQMSACITMEAAAEGICTHAAQPYGNFSDISFPI